MKDELPAPRRCRIRGRSPSLRSAGRSVPNNLPCLGLAKLIPLSYNIIHRLKAQEQVRLSKTSKSAREWIGSASFTFSL
ncbi:F-box protein [Cohnella soli]|uniref:F-box protein n=1 Tax=Cohnella soli TaxID=425005 RepID=A0ABW0HRV0_9BACL